MHCAWRACHDLLPTRAKLVTNGYEGTLQCLSCPHPYETTAHLFCACPIETTILSGSHLDITVLMSSIFNFKEWMLEQASSFSDDKFQKLLMIIWGLWCNRTTLCGMTNSRQHKKLFVALCLDIMNLSLSITLNKSNQRHRKELSGSPAIGQLKLNVDAAFMPNETEGVGGILRNGQGIAVATFTKHISGITSAKQAELEAIRVGLSWLQAYNFVNCILETDCQVVVNEIQLQDYLPLEFSNIINDIHGLLEGLEDVHVYTPRTANAIAHRLVSAAFESVAYVHWMHGCHPFYAE
ncbi:hypothetical protein ACLB2K_053680 [Fragaria x ananassa]